MTTAADTFAAFLDTLAETLDQGSEERARRLHLSRFHLDRVVSATGGEPPERMRRRLLLERAARGERFVITRHGKPVAQLIPFDEGDVASIREAIDTVATIRKRLRKNGVTLAGMLDEGDTARDLAHAGHKY